MFWVCSDFLAGTYIAIIDYSLLQHVSDHDPRHSRQRVLISPAERKVFVVFLYYLFFGVFQLTTHSLLIKDIDPNIMVVHAFSQCQRSGINESCSLDTKYIEMWSLFTNIVLFLLPVINLYFAMNISSFLTLCKYCPRRVTHFHSITHSNSSPHQTEHTL